MQDTFLDRLWTDHHDGFSADVNRGVDRVGQWVRHPLPIGKQLFAVAAALALSLTSTLAAVGPVDAPADAPQIAAALDRDGSPANRTERA